MAKGDINVKLRAEELGRSLEGLAGAIEEEFQSAVKNATYGAYAKIIAAAQETLNSTRQDYLKGLTIEELGPNQYLINLNGSFPNALEAGWAAYDMRASMLKSQKTVEVGSRAGLPWVQKGKKGQKYAHVPFEHKPFAKGGNANASDMGALIRGMEATNRSGQRQKLTKIFKDASGNPLEGKVAQMNNFSGTDKNSKNLEGLVKFQKVYKNETSGKSTVQSVYMTWRTVSENGDPWMRPANPGLHAFEQAEKWLDSQIDDIIKAFTQ